MPVTFYGNWSFEVVGNVGEFPQRAVIAGSVASDGIVSGTIGTKVASIDGPSWTLTLRLWCKRCRPSNQRPGSRHWSRGEHCIPNL
jgi:hypothetical protein